MIQIARIGKFFSFFRDVSNLHSFASFESNLKNHLSQFANFVKIFDTAEEESLKVCQKVVTESRQLDRLR